MVNNPCKNIFTRIVMFISSASNIYSFGNNNYVKYNFFSYK